MPYRHAHYYLLLLFPLTALAFWPSYFSQFRASPYAFHVHGITASLWIGLLAVQSWSIHHRRNALHRSLGLASFALFPFFVAGGFLVLQTMAAKFGAQADPFYERFGARLGALDTLSSFALPALFYMALKQRRKVHLHARWMLATVFFLIPPIVSRLMPALPPLAITGPETFYRFGYGVQISFALTIGLALALAARAPKHRRPWLATAGLVAVQALLFQTLGQTQTWERLYVSLSAVPVPLLVSFAFALSIAATWAGWLAGMSPQRRDAAAAPA
jgi:hypothetical protein